MLITVPLQKLLAFFLKYAIINYDNLNKEDKFMPRKITQNSENSEEIRLQKQREAEKVCLKCQQKYLDDNPGMSTSFLLNRCRTCNNGAKLKQLDPPQQRGLVGGWQPW